MMNPNNGRIEPQRVLQKYSAEKQKQFKDMSALAKLEWLEAINRLYWAGIASRQFPNSNRKSA